MPHAKNVAINHLPLTKSFDFLVSLKKTDKAQNCIMSKKQQQSTAIDQQKTIAFRLNRPMWQKCSMTWGTALRTPRAPPQCLPFHSHSQNNPVWYKTIKVTVWCSHMGKFSPDTDSLNTFLVTLFVWDLWLFCYLLRQTCVTENRIVSGSEIYLSKQTYQLTINDIGPSLGLR